MLPLSDIRSTITCLYSMIDTCIRQLITGLNQKNKQRLILAIIFHVTVGQS